MLPELAGNFHRAPDRRLRTAAKNQCTAVARRQTKQFIFCLRQAELLRSTNDLLQRLKLLALLVNEQLRVTDNVDEQDVTDFESHVWRMLGRHTSSSYPEARVLTSRIILVSEAMLAT